MNFTRLNEIFCKEVVNELEKIHKHRTPVVYVLDTTIVSHCLRATFSYFRMFDVNFHSCISARLSHARLSTMRLCMLMFPPKMCFNMLLLLQ